MTIKYLLAFALSVLSYPAISNSDINALNGVWNGVIGKSKVTACFFAKPPYVWGATYYQNELVPIRLFHNRKDSLELPIVMLENDIKYGGVWRIENIREGTLNGSWTSKNKSQFFHLHFTRISSPESVSRRNNSCSSDKFNLPLEYNREPIYGKVVETNNLSYRKVTASLDDNYFIQTVEFLGDAPNQHKLNKYLNWVNVQQFMGASLDRMYSIRRNLTALGLNHLGTYSYKINISLLAHLIFIKVEESAEAERTEFSKKIFTLNSLTGEEVKIAKWFKGVESMEPGWVGIGRLPKATAKFVYSKIGMDKQDFTQCYPYLNEPEVVEYNFEVTSNSIRFQLPGGCRHIFTIPFSELMPYLSEEGLENINNLVSAQK